MGISNRSEKQSSRRRSAFAGSGVLPERSSKAGGNLVDTDCNLGGNGIDGTGDLCHERFLGGKITNGLDLVLRQKLAFEKTALGFRLFGVLLESLNGLHCTAHIPFDKDKSVGAGKKGIKV